MDRRDTPPQQSEASPQQVLFEAFNRSPIKLSDNTFDAITRYLLADRTNKEATRRECGMALGTWFETLENAEAVDLIRTFNQLDEIGPQMMRADSGMFRAIMRRLVEIMQKKIGPQRQSTVAADIQLAAQQLGMKMPKEDAHEYQHGIAFLRALQGTSGGFEERAAAAMKSYYDTARHLEEAWASTQVTRLLGWSVVLGEDGHDEDRSDLALAIIKYAPLYYDQYDTNREEFPIPTQPRRAEAQVPAVQEPAIARETHNEHSLVCRVLGWLTGKR